jgi:carboxyl-terminal processing protease
MFTMACALLSRAAPTPPPTSDATARHLTVFEVMWTAVRDQYVRPDYDGVDWEAVGQMYRAKVEAGLDEATFAESMRAMLAELPEGGASFQTRAERLEQETTDASQYEGIGAFIAFRAAPTPHIVILAVIQDSPAEEAGLQAHDSIYAIDGEPVRADDEASPAVHIRGPADTSVTLTVQSPGGERREVTIPRAQITATDVLRGGVEPSLEVAYFRVPVVVTQDIVSIMTQNLAEAAQNDQLAGVIVDLRVAHSSAQGWPLHEMLTVFANGDLGEFYTRTTTETLTVEGQDSGGSQSVPLVILIGPDTEGSPEILAAALRGAQRAKLVGLPTAGAVEGFSEIPLTDGSWMFLATSSFRTLDGADLAQQGVEPDVRVEEDWDEVISDDDPAIHAALRLLSP